MKYFDKQYVYNMYSWNNMYTFARKHLPCKLIRISFIFSLSLSLWIKAINAKEEEEEKEKEKEKEKEIDRKRNNPIWWKLRQDYLLTDRFDVIEQGLR